MRTVLKVTDQKRKGFFQRRLVQALKLPPFSKISAKNERRKSTSCQAKSRKSHVIVVKAVDLAVNTVSQEVEYSLLQSCPKPWSLKPYRTMTEEPRMLMSMRI